MLSETLPLIRSYSSPETTRREQSPGPLCGIGQGAFPVMAISLSRKYLGERAIPKVRVVWGLILRDSHSPFVRCLRARLCHCPSESSIWSSILPAATMLWRSLLDLEPQASDLDASVAPSGLHL